MKSLKLSWLLFLVLGGLMWWLRYDGGLSGSDLKMMIQYGPWVVLVIHIMLVLTAFKDNIFQGILCLLIPLYSFYWLFIVSDLFLVRAAVAGLLVGIGMDSAMFYQKEANTVIDAVRNYIASGG